MASYYRMNSLSEELIMAPADRPKIICLIEKCWWQLEN